MRRLHPIGLIAVTVFVLAELHVSRAYVYDGVAKQCADGCYDRGNCNAETGM
jgi:hypothetical protein